MIEALSLTFVQNAILAGVLASVACGTIGSLVVVNRQVFLAGGVAHAAYGGVGLGIFLGLPVLPCAVAFTALAALVAAHFTVERRERSDSFVGVLWATGMALGIILLNLTPGYNVDLMSYLFGSILTVPRADIWAMLVLDAAVVLVSHDLISATAGITDVAVVNRQLIQGREITPRMLELVYGVHGSQCPLDGYMQSLSAMFEAAGRGRAHGHGHGPDHGERA